MFFPCYLLNTGQRVTYDERHIRYRVTNTLGQTHIDYFSLDVERAEMIILQSIDWKHFYIDVFTIETDQHRPPVL
jgi:hypothetical protein